MAALARLSRGLRALGRSRVMAFPGSAGEQAGKTAVTGSAGELASKNAFTGSAGLKIPLVKSASDPTCCYILSSHGVSEFPIERFIPVETFVKDNPIFDKVPLDRLVLTVDSDKPYRTSEKARRWIRSGYIIPYFCGLQSLNLLDPFFEGNVGILKGCDVLCFKRLHLVSKRKDVDPTHLVKNSSFSTFLKGLVKDGYGSLTSIPKGLGAVIDIADSEAPFFKELIFHPEFMPDHLLSFIFMEYHRLVRRQFPTRGDDRVALKIMNYVHKLMGDNVSRDCRSHNLLRQWCQSHFQVDGTGQKTGLGALTSKEKKKFKTLKRKMLKDYLLQVDSMKPNLPAALVFDVHRHSQAHIVEPPVEKVALSLSHKNTLRTSPHTWRDAIVLLHHLFPLFPHLANRAFHIYKWHMLSIECRFPIPQIFEAPANAVLVEYKVDAEVHNEEVESDPVGRREVHFQNMRM